MVTDLPPRIAAKINVGDCWEWTAARFHDGYGSVSWNRATKRAHRVVYELLVGSIPTGIQTDHLCRNRICVNPDHLELVTHKVNCARGHGIGAVHSKQTECRHGHPFDEANTYHYRGWRLCRACNRKAVDRYQKGLIS